MKSTGNPDRLRQLAVAFRKISQTAPELRVDPPAERSLPKSSSEVRSMFRVRLRNASGDAQARMFVHDRGAKLETRVEGQRRAASAELPIDLRKGYRWDVSVFSDASELADVMYKHMTRQLEAAADGAN